MSNLSKLFFFFFQYIYIILKLDRTRARMSFMYQILIIQWFEFFSCVKSKSMTDYT